MKRRGTGFRPPGSTGFGDGVGRGFLRPERDRRAGGCRGARQHLSHSQLRPFPALAERTGLHQGILAEPGPAPSQAEGGCRGAAIDRLGAGAVGGGTPGLAGAHLQPGARGDADRTRAGFRAKTLRAVQDPIPEGAGGDEPARGGTDPGAPATAVCDQESALFADEPGSHDHLRIDRGHPRMAQAGGLRGRDIPAGIPGPRGGGAHRPGERRRDSFTGDQPGIQAGLRRQSRHRGRRAPRRARRARSRGQLRARPPTHPSAATMVSGNRIPRTAAGHRHFPPRQMARDRIQHPGRE
jgi:hypothetical protein